MLTSKGYNMAQRKKLGEIFVENGIITQQTADRVLARAQFLGKRFGTVLEDLDLVTGDELANALAVQYGCKVVNNLSSHNYPAELLEFIPVEVAMQNMLFPLKREKDRLALAMADPTETKIVGNMAADNGLVIVPFIATKKEVYAAICKHYLGKEVSTRRDRTVLVVEDDKLIRSMLSDTLGKVGYRVVTAQDGMEAYKAVIIEKPQVIITDKEMPKLDGYGLFDSLKNIPETRIIPVILITSRMNAEEEAKAFDKGFFDFINKPVKDATLLTRVKRAFQYYDRQYRLS